MRRTQIPYALLVLGLVLTAAAAQYASKTATARDHLRFENAAAGVQAAIDSRMDAYIAMLLGGAGLFAASEHVQLPDFQAYVERLELARRYPGIQGIGFSRLVRPEERLALAATIRQYVPSFDYHGGDADAPVHAIVFLEPLDRHNRVALGYDMHSEPTRRRAMDQARDTGAPAATRRVRLVEEMDPPRQQSGFLIYVPVYRGGGIPPTVEERRSRLMGFVYSPFRGWDLLRGIEGTIQPTELSFDVFDGTPDEGRLLHKGRADDMAARFMTELATEVAGQRWTLVVRSGPAFARTSGRALAMLIAIGGGLLSVLLFSVTRTQIDARDMAERTADELRRSEEALRSANQAKDEFLAVVSHELRTPLNAIVGWTAMLRRGQVPPERQAHAIRVIERNAAAQARLIEDLLDISRAVAGRLRLGLASVDVGGLLKSATDALRPDAAAQHIELETAVPDDLGTVCADSARLQQVVFNVLANAIKFTEEGGRVSLTASRDADWVTVQIRDTGMGIPAEFLPHVFERFRQADTSTTRAHSGVGLGLAISRHIVELHGGTIEAASAGEGLGTTFTIRLPSNPPKPD